MWGYCCSLPPEGDECSYSCELGREELLVLGLPGAASTRTKQEKAAFQQSNTVAWPKSCRRPVSRTCLLEDVPLCLPSLLVLSAPRFRFCRPLPLQAA